MTYTNVFGGENINPADLSYTFYNFSGADLSATVDLALVWPFEALDGRNVVADKIDVASTATAGHSLSMPDATLASVGEDVLWNNVGGTTFAVRRYDGTVICTISPGTQWYVYLIDNSSPAGAWRAVQMGASTSSANAAALAGYGLRATETAKLDQNYLTNGVIGNITLTSTSRAQVFRNTGGGAIHSIAAVATLGPPPNANNGWFVVEINAGDGNITLTPTAGELIDGQASKVLSPGESCVVYCFGVGFATMGYGRALTSSVTGTSIDLSSGSGTLILSANQLAAQVQDFTGTLTGNRVISYGGVTGYWFVYNHTTNSPGNTFTLSTIGGPGDATPIVIAPETFTILRSQAGLQEIAFTATSGTVTSITGVTDQIITSPDPLTSTGTIDLTVIPDLAPGTYGGVPAESPAAVVTGYISGTALTVTAVTSGALAVGQIIFGTGVAANTLITALGIDSSSYLVSISQTVGSVGSPIEIEAFVPVLPVTKVPILTLDNRGRVRVASQSDISITSVQVLDLGSVFQYLIPPGTMVQYGGTQLPQDVPTLTTRAWLLCDGSMVSKTNYPRLWAAIGQTYGAATGSPPTGSTGSFKLPDTRGRVLAGLDKSPPVTGWTGTGEANRLSNIGLGGATTVGDTLGGSGGQETTTTTVNVGGANVSVSGGKVTGSVTTTNGDHTLTVDVGTSTSNVSIFHTTGSNSMAQGGHSHSGTINLTTHSNALEINGGSIDEDTPAGGKVVSDGASSKTTAAIKTVQPTLMIRHLIKT